MYITYDTRVIVRLEKTCELRLFRLVDGELIDDELF